MMSSKNVWFALSMALSLSSQNRSALAQEALPALERNDVGVNLRATSASALRGKNTTGAEAGISATLLESAGGELLFFDGELTLMSSSTSLPGRSASIGSGADVSALVGYDFGKDKPGTDLVVAGVGSFGGNAALNQTIPFEGGFHIGAMLGGRYRSGETLVIAGGTVGAAHLEINEKDDLTALARGGALGGQLQIFYKDNLAIAARYLAVPEQSDMAKSGEFFVGRASYRLNPTWSVEGMARFVNVRSDKNLGISEIPSGEVHQNNYSKISIGVRRGI